MAVSIDRIKIRAEVLFNGISVVTPNILSFNVRKSRGQPSATFSASLRVPHDKFTSTTVGQNANVVIKAGEDTPGSPIFTGYVYRISINPSRTDSSVVIVNIAGKDVMSVMEGQNITRRVPAQQLAKWGSITGIIAKRDKFKERFPLKIRNAEPRLTWSQIQEYDQFVVGSPDPTAVDLDGTGATGTAGKHSITDLTNTTT